MVSITLAPVVGAVCCVGDGAGDGAGVVDQLPSAAIIFAMSACCLAIVALRQAINVALPWLATWRVVVSYPGTVIRTADARRVLPKQVAMTTASEAAAQLAGFVSALYQGDEALALDCLTDVLAEPHRQSLIPMLQPLRAQAQQLGIQHLGISGAGPTLFAICRNDEQAQAMYDLFVAHYHHTADAMTHICRIDTQGARCLDSQDNHDEVS